MSGGVAAAVSASIAVCLALAVLHFGLCDALASLWGTRAGAFAPVEAAAAICHGGLLTGHSAAVLSATTRCFREITRSISVLQPAFSAHFSCSLLGDVIVPTTAWPPLYT